MERVPGHAPASPGVEKLAISTIRALAIDAADRVLPELVAALDDDEIAHPDVVLLATGSEVQLALEAQQLLASDDVIARVVTMPSWAYFEDTDDDYQDDVLPADIPVVSIEQEPPSDGNAGRTTPSASMTSVPQRRPTPRTLWTDRVRRGRRSGGIARW